MVGMIPDTWLPRHRPDDDELVGYLDPAGTGLAVPRTVFGFALAAALPEDDAADLLDATGLAVLAERWVLVRDGHDDLRVRIAEVDANRVIVGVDDYNVGIRHADRIEVPVPTGEALRLA